MLGSENSRVGQAMFDVKPVDESGSVDVQKIKTVQPTVNLASFRPKKRLVAQKQELRIKNQWEKVTSLITPSTEILPPVIGLPSQQDLKEQFEKLMSHDLDLGIELAKMGGNSPKLSEEKLRSARPRYPIIRNHPASVSAPEPDLYAPLISDIH